MPVDHAATSSRDAPMVGRMPTPTTAMVATASKRMMRWPRESAVAATATHCRPVADMKSVALREGREGHDTSCTWSRRWSSAVPAHPEGCVPSVLPTAMSSPGSCCSTYSHAFKSAGGRAQRSAKQAEHGYTARPGGQCGQPLWRHMSRQIFSHGQPKASRASALHQQFVGTHAVCFAESRFCLCKSRLRRPPSPTRPRPLRGPFSQC